MEWDGEPLESFAWWSYTWSDKPSKKGNKEFNRNQEKPGEGSVGGVSKCVHKSRLCPNTKSGRTSGMTYRRQTKSGETLQEMKSGTPSSLPDLHLFCILTRDTAAGSNTGFPTRKIFLSKRPSFYDTYQIPRRAKRKYMLSYLILTASLKGKQYMAAEKSWLHV